MRGKIWCSGIEKKVPEMEEIATSWRNAGNNEGLKIATKDPPQEPPEAISIFIWPILGSDSQNLKDMLLKKKVWFVWLVLCLAAAQIFMYASNLFTGASCNP